MPPERYRQHQPVKDAEPAAIKLPELWTHRVRGWFAQAEAQFMTKGVTPSLTRYFYLFQALSQKTIERIPHLLAPAA